jgi:hypothetical protein
MQGRSSGCTGQLERRCANCTGANRCQPVDISGIICMLICMRTTLIIDDILLRRAKELAAKRGCTVSDIVNQALGEALEAREVAKPPFEMITYGSSDRSHHEPADFAAALEADDAAALGG